MSFRTLVAFACLSLATAGCGAPPPRKIAVDHTALRVTESGNHAAFAVWLTARPTEKVVIGVHSTNEAEGTVSPSELVFLDDNWDRAQNVEVTGVDDAVKDGDQRFSVVLEDVRSRDLDFLGLDGPVIDVVNTDDESPAVVLAPSPPTRVVEGKAVELGLKLTARPSAPVRVMPRITKNGARVALDRDELVFHPVTWDKPQTLTLVAPDGDKIDRGPEKVTIGFAPTESDDPLFSGLEIADVVIERVDDDVASIDTVTALSIDEGGSAEVSVALNSQPNADVTIAPSVIWTTSNPQISMTPTQLVFTAANWSQPQRFTLRAADDWSDLPNVTATLRLVSASTDAHYNALSRDVALTVVDNDTPAIALKVIMSQPETRESGDMGTRCVVASVAKATYSPGEVWVTLSSSDPTEGVPMTTRTRIEVYPTVIQICGVDDQIVDGDRGYTITARIDSSTDPQYPTTLAPAVLMLTNRDDGELTGDTCGQAIPLTLGADAVTWSTTNLHDDFGPSCGAMGRDIVFSIPVGGNQKVRVEADAGTSYASIFLREQCTPTSMTSCPYYGANSQGKIIAVYTNPAATPTTVYAIVEGTLSVKIAASVMQ